MLVALMGAVSLVIFLRLGWFGFITDSEIWAVTIAKNFGEDWWQPWVITRPFFYSILALAVWPADDAVTSIFLAKAVCLINGVILVFMTYRLSKRLNSRSTSPSDLVPWLAILILLSNTSFLNQGARIRSDLFACAFVLLALTKTVDMIFQDRKDLRLFGLFWLLPLLATPKAVMQILPAVVFLPTFMPRALFQPESRKRLWFYLGASIVLVAATSPLYLDSFRYFVNAMLGVRKTDGAVLILTEESFFFLLRTLKQNPVFIGMVFFRLVFLYSRVQANDFPTEASKRVQSCLALFCCLELLLVVVLPDRFPFLIAALIPPFSVLASMLPDDIAYFIRKGRLPRTFTVPAAYAWVFLSIAIFVGAIDWSIECIKNDSNQNQFTLIRYLDRYLSNYPKALYFDSIGIVPQRAFPRRFVGPSDDAANNSALQWITDGKIQETGEIHRPDLIFYVTKLHLLEPELPGILEADFSHIGQGVYGRWLPLRPELPADETSRKVLQEFIGEQCLAVGLSRKAAERGRFRFLLRNPDGKTRFLDATLDEVLSLSAKNGRGRSLPTISKVSIFTELKNPPPLRIPTVFSFDSNY